LTRVLFVHHPEYVRRILSLLTGRFSSRITYEIVTYTVTGRVRPNRLKSEDIRLWLLGDPRLRSAIASFEPDIVFSDSPLYGAHSKILSLLVRSRVPLIIHLRGDPWREYWARFLVTKPPLQLLMPQEYVYNWASLFLARKIAPVCKWLGRVVRTHIPGKKIEVVYPPVDITQYYEQDGLEFQRPAVAIIQNHNIYLKVLGLMNLRKVVQRLPDVHFYISEGESAQQQFLPMVKNYYRGLKNVHFITGIDNPAGIRMMLAASDCYVLATGLDCCPVTVLEASLMRRPVIASRVGGVPEIVLENETGWTIGNGDIENWVEKIRLVATDTKLNRRLGQNGREFVSRHFGSEVIATQMERLILNEAIG
jgi:glycosyltransferase involved in cell wall biosynthesis